MATKKKPAPIPYRVGLGLLPADLKQLSRLKKSLGKTLDGKITTIRVIRLGLSFLEDSLDRS